MSVLDTSPELLAERIRAAAIRHMKAFGAPYDYYSDEGLADNVAWEIVKYVDAFNATKTKLYDIVMAGVQAMCVDMPEVQERELVRALAVNARL